MQRQHHRAMQLAEFLQCQAFALGPVGHSVTKPHALHAVAGNDVFCKPVALSDFFAHGVTP